MLKRLSKIHQKFSPEKLKIISNIGWLVSERIFGMVINFVVVIYVVRYLGSANFGKLSYCISFVGLFEAIAKLGLDDIVVRNLVREKEYTNIILGSSFILKLIGSLVACSLIFISSLSFNNDWQTQLMTLIIALGLVFTSFDVIDYWFQSQVQSGAIAIVRSGQLILNSLAKLIFVIWQFPLIAFAWLILIDYLGKAIARIWVYWRHHYSLFDWRFNWSQARRLLKDSSPLILSGVMVAIYMKIDQVMLGNLANDQAVGNYAAAVRFSEIWYFIPIAICSSVYPAIIQAKQRSEQEYYSKLQQLYDLMVWIALAIAVPMTFVAKPLMIRLLGAEYAEAGEILAWHIWAGVFVFLGVARSKWLMVENFTVFSFATTSIGALTNVILNFLFIPTYQGNGAAIATVISYAVAAYFACIFYPPMFKTGWMLTKALFIPLRFRQNLVYFQAIKTKLL
ncbi:polysaccharide biosynthesis protein [Stanieria cyanosphaera PCC 7437]|uniref:Polysaccharide biosynthesis protein n=1 Tax=Stanieria cyanosphaera (strain ATCC 29371 / PCC 7437) TaxID=111780 RepID=K9XMM0_STAC7|nr:flippase [Stanieria cyanosphaera]AFZ33850.1 polysaccharide biosynthesis protein [Stanieria cyanosphaera PCC 7437]